MVDEIPSFARPLDAPAATPAAEIPDFARPLELAAEPAPGPQLAPSHETVPPGEPEPRRALLDQPRPTPSFPELSADTTRLGEILGWMDKNTALNRQQAVEVARISAASSHPAEYVAQHLDELRSSYPADATDWPALAEQHPDLAHLLLADPARFAMLKDATADMAWYQKALGRWSLETVESPTGVEVTRPRYDVPLWLAVLRDSTLRAGLQLRKTAGEVVEQQRTSPELLEQRRAFAAVQIARDQGISVDEAYAQVPEPTPAPAGDFERENAAAIGELEQETAPRDYGEFERTIWGKVLLAPFRLAPAMLGGMGATAVAGPAGGIAWWTALNYGESAEQLKGLQGKDGKKLDPDEASRLALASSLFGSALMEAGVGPLFHHLPGPLFERAIGEAGARVLTSPGIAARLTKAIGQIGLDAVAGASASAAQEASNAVAQEAARSELDPEHRFDWKEVAGRTAEVWSTSLVEMLALGAIGAGNTALRDRGQRLAAQDSAEGLRALTRFAQDSKIFKDLPAEEAKKVVAELKVRAGLKPDEVVDTVYATREQFERYWQEKKVDPRQAAEEIAPGAYDKAVAEKSDTIAFPVEDYLAKFATAGNGEHARALAGDLKLRPDVNTPREEAAEITARTTRMKELAGLKPDEMEEDQRRVHDEFRRQAIEAGEDEKVADANALLYSAVLKTFAERAGRGETAWDLWQIHPLNIEGPHSAANRARAHYMDALADFDAHPAGQAWSFLRAGKAEGGLEPIAARLREQAAARGEIPADLRKKIEKVQGRLTEVEGDAARAKSPLRTEQLAVEPDPETGIPALRALAPGEAAPAETRPLRIPAWLDSKAFLGDRQAWEWTWSATGLDASEHLQKLVHGYMAKAFEGLEPNETAIQQAWAVARLAAGKGGRKLEGLRAKLLEWMREPEGARAEDPIPERAWPHLLTFTRKDSQYVSAGKFINKKRVEVFQKWLKTTAGELSEERSTYAQRPPEWFAKEGEAAPAKGVARAAALREQLAALNEEARAAAKEHARLKPKLDLDAAARILGKDAEKIPTEKGGVDPDELALAVGAEGGDALLRDMVERRDRSSWAKTEAAARAARREAPRAAVPLPEASRQLAPRWLAMTPEERAREFFIDRNTGILNDRGFFALPPDPARPIIGHISVEGTKWLNDSGEAGGHEQGDRLYRMAARALHAIDPEAAKVGGDFAVRVRDQAHLDEIVGRLNAEMPVPGFTATGVVGESFRAAHDAHVALKERLEAAGTRALRGERPRGVAAERPSDVVLPAERAAARLPDALRERHAALTPREAFEAAYVEPGTGLLTAAGWNGIPRKRYVASLDLDGLKALNERLGTAGGDEILAYFGELAREHGGPGFDVAHLHGDEYAAQSDDAPALQGFLDKLAAMSDSVRVEVEAADGSVHEVQGIGFSRGIGRTNGEAERALQDHKAERARSGKRGPEADARRLREVEAAAGRPEDDAGRRGPLGARGAADARGAPRQAWPGNAGAPQGVAAGRLEQAGKVDPAAPAFRAWFGESKVVDAEGKPLIAFHGAKRPDRIGSVFRRSRATSGPMAFFTDDPAIASGYAQNKADTSLEAPSDYAGWFKFKVGRANVDVDRAWWHLTPEKRAELAQKIPHVVWDNEDGHDTIRLGGPEEWGLASKEHWDHTLREARGNPLRAAVENWLNSAMLFDQEERFLEVLRAAGLEGVEFDSPWTEYPSVFPVYLSIEKPLDTTAIPPEVLATLEKASRRQRAPKQGAADMWDKRALDPRDWMQRLSEDQKEGTTHAWTSIPDWATKILRELGYDGIHDTGGKYHDVQHTVWIPFEETQVKGVFNRGSWDPTNKNILRQGRLVDNIGGQDVRLRIEQKKKGEEGPRGYLEFPDLEPGKEAPFFAHLLDSDRSTLAHESFHALSLIMGQLAGRADAPAGLKAEYERLVQVMGYESAAARTAKRIEAKEEKGSHLWEMYIAEGKAPSRELLPTFSRMRGWLRRVYQRISIADQYRARYGEGLVLSDDAREIFGRLLAGDDAVADAAKDFEVEIPKVAFTPAEQAESDRLRAEGLAEAQAEIQRLLVDEDRKADREFMRSARARLGKEVEAKLDQEPAYGALAALGRGDVAGMKVRLERGAVEDVVGKDVANRLPAVVFDRDGVPPDAIAKALHFPTGADLVLAMANAEPRAARVKREVAALMASRYPTLQDRPRLMYEAAKGALSGDAFLRDGILRARAMAREAGLRPRVTDAEGLKRAAEAIVQDQQVSASRPDRFEMAAKRHARQAAELKDPEKRLDAYEAYLFNRSLYRAALAAHDRAEKTAGLINRYTQPKWRAKLGKATDVEVVDGPDGAQTTRVTQPYLEKMDEVLQAFEFSSSVPMKEVRGRAEQKAALEKWVSERWADGDSVVIPASVLDALGRQTHWKDLTFRELEDLRGAVESIAQQAELRSQYIVGGEKIATGRVIEELREAAIANGAHVRQTFSEATRTRWEKLRELGRQGKHLIESPELVYDALDGFKADGPWRKYVWNPVSDASYRYHDIIRDSKERVDQILEGLAPEERKRLRETRFEVEGETYTLEAAVVVALNMGTESNETKMVRGMSDPRARDLFSINGIWHGRGTVDRFLEQLSAKDVALVNEIHKALESLWPASEALEKHDVGIAPPKVPVRPLTFVNLKGETLKIEGGYYPMIYSRKFRVGKTQAEADTLAANGLPGLFQPGYERMMTPQGHLQERIESYARPIDLTLDALPRKLTMSAKDIAFRLVGKQAYRVLMDERIVGALTQALGDHGHDLVVEHLRGSVNDVMLPDAGAGLLLRIFRRMRDSAFRQTFALNAAQTMQNLADPVGVANVMPVRYFTAASLRLTKEISGEVPRMVREWSTKPEAGSLRALILSLSPEMRLRADGMSSLARDLESTFRRTKLGLRWEHAQHVMMAPFEFTQAMTEYPTWLGAFEHARDTKEGGLGLDEKEAVRHADDMVRRMYGGRRTIDLTPIQRNAITRWFTMYAGWGLAQVNQFMRAMGEGKVRWNEDQAWRAVALVGRAFALLAAKQLVSEVLVGNGPERDEKTGKLGAGDVAKWAAYRGVMWLPMSTPVLGAALRSADQGATRDVSLTPWANFLTAGAKALAKSQHVASEAFDGTVDEDQELDLFLAWLDAGGAFTGLPTAQTRRTAHYLMNRSPDATPGEDVLGTMYGPSRPGKLSHTLYGR